MLDSKYRVSLEIAKKLKENNFPQEDCDAYWCSYGGKNFMLESVQARNVFINRMKCSYAAPGVGRLGDELPSGIKTYKINEENNGWDVVDKDGSCYFWAQDTEANARALMWIQLKQKEIIGKGK